MLNIFLNPHHIIDLKATIRYETNLIHNQINPISSFLLTLDVRKICKE